MFTAAFKRAQLSDTSSSPGFQESINWKTGRVFHSINDYFPILKIFICKKPRKMIYCMCFCISFSINGLCRIMYLM